MLIWDSADPPPVDAGRVYLWNGYAETGDVFALLQYVEEHAEGLRRKYLAWIHELGETRVRGKRVVDHLGLRDGLSFWWLTPFVEKHFQKFPISQALRLFALEEIVAKEDPKTIKLVTSEHWLHQTLSAMCRTRGIHYEWERLPEKRRSIGERVRVRLPHLLQASRVLTRYLRFSKPFRTASKTEWLDDPRALFVCGYFSNIDPDEAARGRFRSRYWGGLHRLLEGLDIKANWLHVNPVQAPETAMKWVRSFNAEREREGCHAFLDAYRSSFGIARAVRRFAWLQVVSWRLRRMRDAFRTPDATFSLWPLLGGAWHSSLRGGVAMDNLLAIELFDAALRELPRQSQGVYLCENHGWERALVHAWRKHGHGRLVAVAHATVRFWDLRYSMDARTLRSAAPYAIPRPHVTALNGEAAVKAYRGADYPHEIVECEALRYAYLSGFRKNRKTPEVATEALRVLALGDISRVCSLNLLTLLQDASHELPSEFSYSLKAHPVCNIDPDEFPSLKLTSTSRPLGEIVHDFDVAVSANATSAAVDLHLAGVPVVVVLDASELNFSPLRGRPNVRFVATSSELAAILKAPDTWCNDEPDPDDFFFLDSTLPRWRRLLRNAPQA